MKIASGCRADPAPSARVPAAEEAGRLALGGVGCVVMCVDSVVPEHVAGKAGGRLRLIYLPDEIAHFEFGGHRYSLVATPPERAAADDGDDGDDEPNQPSKLLHELLTQRELQIVQLISLGFLTKQVADRLSLSEFTVRSYLKSIYAKLRVRSRAALVFRYTRAFNPAR